MRTLLTSLIFIAFLSACNRSSGDKPGLTASDELKPDSLFFKSLVTRYTESIDKADTALGAKLWSHTDPVSFIHPKGHEHGWEGVKNIYAVFRENFTDRKLTFYNLKTSVYDDFAWLEFYWNFEALMKNGGSKVQTEGRETQVWRKTADGWRLIHVHYSAMPQSNTDS